ncbi:hypothetical protein Hanom_Chr17g01581821 [Helianthus anomalus]
MTLGINEQRVVAYTAAKTLGENICSKPGIPSLWCLLEAIERLLQPAYKTWITPVNNTRRLMHIYSLI